MPILSQALQRRSQFRLPQQPPGARRAIAIEKNASRFGQAAQVLLTQCSNAGIPIVHGKPVARQTDGRRKRDGERQCSVTTGNVHESSRGARNPRSRAAPSAGPADRLSFPVHVLLRLRTARRGFARVHHHLVAIACAMEKKKTAAAKSG